MSASSAQTQAHSGIVIESSDTQSCARFPLVLLFFSAAIWLFISSLLALIASIKFHAPGFLGNSAWLTYGRIYPAYWSALIYGFAIPGGLAVCLALLSRIGQTRIMLPGLASVGAVVWNFGAFIGIAGVLHGDSTGFDWLEIPSYASPILFVGYSLIGISALVTLAHRRVWELSAAQWFLIAALFWFPWIYSAANLLLVFAPVRGVMQAVVNWWFVNNLKVWFSLIGLGTLLHLVPNGTGRPLHDRSLVLFSFWMFLFIAPWAGIPNGSPLPAWIPAVSTVASVLVLLPVVAIVMNLGKTIGGDCQRMKQNPTLRFMQFALPCWVIFVLASAVTSVPQISAIVNFTWLTPATTRLMVFGFFVLTIFGAAQDIVPGLIPSDVMCPRCARLQFISGSAGIALYFVSLVAGGIMQGLQLANPGAPISQVLQKWLMPFRLSTLGDILILVASACFLAKVLRVIGGCCRSYRAKRSEVA